MIIKIQKEEFEDVMNRILDEALCRHSADVNAQWYLQMANFKNVM